MNKTMPAFIARPSGSPMAAEEMIGHYLGEFSITYKPIKHGRAGMMGKNSQFVPLK